MVTKNEKFTAQDVACGNWPLDYFKNGRLFFFINGVIVVCYSAGIDPTLLLFEGTLWTLFFPLDFEGKIH